MAMLTREGWFGFLATPAAPPPPSMTDQREKWLAAIGPPKEEPPAIPIPEVPRQRGRPRKT